MFITIYLHIEMPEALYKLTCLKKYIIVKEITNWYEMQHKRNILANKTLSVEELIVWAIRLQGPADVDHVYYLFRMLIVFF